METDDEIRVEDQAIEHKLGNQAMHIRKSLGLR